MKCPFCAYADTKVIDSRPDKDSAAIRRRRECESCSRRFTTFERVEEMVLPMILKKDGRREPYSRNKVVGGMQKACEKRPVSVDAIQEMANRLEARLLESGEKEISGHVIGEWIMHELHDLDEVAYVRFASVYRSFRDITEFMSELQTLLKSDQKGGRKRSGSEAEKVAP